MPAYDVPDGIDLDDHECPVHGWHESMCGGECDLDELLDKLLDDLAGGSPWTL